MYKWACACVRVHMCGLARFGVRDQVLVDVLVLGWRLCPSSVARMCLRVGVRFRPHLQVRGYSRQRLRACWSSSRVRLSVV